MRNAILAIPMALVFVANAQAAIVHYVAGGTVTTSSDSNVPLGTPFTASFDYDTSATQVPGTNGSASYQLPHDFQLTVAGVNILSSSSTTQNVRFSNLSASDGHGHFIPEADLLFMYKVAATNQAGTPIADLAAN